MEEIFAEELGPESLAKARLAHIIVSLIEARKLSNRQAAETIGVSERKFAELMSGRFIELSFDHLFRFLNALQIDIELVFKDSLGERGEVKVNLGD